MCGVDGSEEGVGFGTGHGVDCCLRGGWGSCVKGCCCWSSRGFDGHKSVYFVLPVGCVVGEVVES